jgi:hypothetical protein
MLFSLVMIISCHKFIKLTVNEAKAASNSVCVIVAVFESCLCKKIFD